MVSAYRAELPTGHHHRIVFGMTLPMVVIRCCYKQPSQEGWLMLEFSHFAEALGGKVTLLKITYLGEEDGIGTGPRVKPTQSQKQSLVSRFLPLSVRVSFLLCFLPYFPRVRTFQSPCNGH